MSHASRIVSYVGAALALSSSAPAFAQFCSIYSPNPCPPIGVPPLAPADPNAPIEQRVANLETGNAYQQSILGQLDQRVANQSFQISQLTSTSVLLLGRIGGLETSQTTLSGLIADLRALQEAQSSTINALSVGLTGQAAMIASIEAAQLGFTGQVAQLQAGQTALNQRIDDIFDLSRRNRVEARRGAAAGIAMGNAPMPSEPGRTSYNFNGANFMGEFAFGGSLMHRLTSGTAVSAGFSMARGAQAGRVGVAGEF